MNVKSELLKVNIPVTEYDGTYVIDHKTIRRILIDYARIKIKTEPQLLTEARCVYLCIASDEETGRCFEAIGESCPRTLINDISRNYRATMAYNRAVDRAVIGLLDVSGINEYYSSLELEDSSDEFALSERSNQNINQNKRSRLSEKKNQILTTDSGEISDDLIVAIGKCANRRYGDVKNTEEFKEFLNYISCHEIAYPDPYQMEQLQLFKKLC